MTNNSREAVPTSPWPHEPSRTRPLVGRQDLLWLGFHFPLRILSTLLGGVFFRHLAPAVESVYQLARTRDKETAARRIAEDFDVTAEEAKRLARQVISNVLLAKLFDLWVRAGRRPPDFWTARFEGREHLDRALQARKGVILVTLHTFAQRRAGMAMAEAGYRFLIVRRSTYQRFGHLGKRLVESADQRWRLQTANDSIEAGDPEVTLRLAQRLRAGGIVLLTPDARSPKSTPAPFLKGVRNFQDGAMEIARITGCAVLPFRPHFDGQDCVIDIGEPLEVQLAGPRGEVRAANLAVLVAALEKQVRQHPDQWRRWADF